MSNQPTVIIIHETALASLIKDAGTLATFVIMIGLGVILASTPMQWVGAMLAIIWVCARAFARARGVPHLSVEAARARLDQIERGIA